MAYGHKKPKTSKGGSKQDFGATRAPRGPGRVGMSSGGNKMKPSPMPTKDSGRQDFGATRAPRGPGRVGQSSSPQDRSGRVPGGVGKRGGRIPGGMGKKLAKAPGKGKSKIGNRKKALGGFKIARSKYNVGG